MRSDPCGACCGSGWYGVSVGTMDAGQNSPRVRCLECRGTGIQNAAQQAIVDAINARVQARRQQAA